MSNAFASALCLETVTTQERPFGGLSGKLYQMNGVVDGKDTLVHLRRVLTDTHYYQLHMAVQDGREASNDRNNFFYSFALSE